MASSIYLSCCLVFIIAQACQAVLIDKSQNFQNTTWPIEEIVDELETIDLLGVLSTVQSISYSFNDTISQNIYIQLRIPASSKNWFGICFNYLMHECNGIAIEYTTVDQIDYIDLYEFESHNYSKPIRASNSSLEYIQYLYSEEDNTRLILFTLQFEENDNNLISIATSDSPTMAFHGRRQNRFIIPLEPGISSDLSDSIVVPQWIYKLHTSFLYFGWGFMIDIGILIARYFKGWKYYILAHQVIFIVLNVSTVAIESLMLIFNQPRISAIVYSDIYMHYIFSCLMLAVLIVQHVIGFIMQKRISDDNKQLSLPIFKQVHKWIGVFLYFLSKGIIFSGKWSSSILKNSNKSHFAISISPATYFNILFYLFYLPIFIYQSTFTLMIIGWVLLEIGHRQGKIQKYVIQFMDIVVAKTKCGRNMISNEQKEQLMKNLNAWDWSQDIKSEKPDLKYCLLGNKVYDMSDFQHPGGSYILNQANGREMHRFVNGQQHLEGIQNQKDNQNIPHKHSMGYLLYLKERYIGEIDYSNRNILIFEDVQEENILNKSVEHNEELEIFDQGNPKKKNVIMNKSYKFQHNYKQEEFEIKNNLDKNSRSSHNMDGQSDYSFSNNEEESNRLSIQNQKKEDLTTPFLNDSASFTIVKKEKSILYFKNNKCSVRNWLLGVEWMGLHFCIYEKGKKFIKNRLYTTVLCFTPYNQKLRAFLATYLDTLLEDSSKEEKISIFQSCVQNRNDSKQNQKMVASVPSHYQNPRTEQLESWKLLNEWRVESVSDKLPFLIKKYRSQDSLSRMLHENQEKVYRIEGPLGRGLELSNNSKGKIVIFANGTGVLPFLDLLFFQLLKSAYLLASQKDQGNKFITSIGRDSNDLLLLSELKIELFLAVESVQHFYGREIIQTLLRFQNALHSDLFSLTLKLKDEKEFQQIEGKFQRTLSYFDAKFIESLPSSILHSAQRIYIAGSYDMMFTLSEAFDLFPQYQQKVTYV